MTPIADSVEEFEVMKNYMFITTRKVSDYAVIISILRSRYYQCVKSKGLMQQGLDIHIPVIVMCV